MKTLFKFLALITGLMGFVFFPIWILTIIFLLAAIACGPVQLREDGNPKSGGMLGGLWDKAILDHKKKRGDQWWMN